MVWLSCDCHHFRGNPDQLPGQEQNKSKSLLNVKKRKNPFGLVQPVALRMLLLILRLYPSTCCDHQLPALRDWFHLLHIPTTYWNIEMPKSPWQSVALAHVSDSRRA